MKSHKLIVVVLVFAFVLVSSGYGQQTAEQLYQSALYKEEIEGEMDAAIKIYETVIKQYPENRSVVAKTYLHIGLCHEKLGNAEARKSYERVVSDYADQTEPTKLARERLSALSIAGAGTIERTEPAMSRIWVAGKNLIVGSSQNGRYIAIYSNETGDLWIHDLQSGEDRQITHEASGVEYRFAAGSAAISPDGKQIAYSWQNKSYVELRISAIDGSNMRVIHNGQDGRSMFPHIWVTDGLRIIAVSYDNKDQSYRLNIISLADNSIRDIGQPDREYIWWKSISPGGKQIAYTRKGDIFICDIATGQETVFVQNPANDYVSGWTPDGSGIVFVSNRSGTYDLYLLGIDNGLPRGDIQMLRRNFGFNAGFLLTHDGRLFRQEQLSTSGSYIVPVDEQTGRVTGTPSLVDMNYTNTSFLEWSQDGKLLYYMVSRGVSMDSGKELKLLTRSEVTGQTREIVLNPKLSYWYRPILSPDGQKFAVTGNDENKNFGILAIDSKSGDVKLLARIPPVGNEIDPSQNWSPDGKAIFYKLRSPEDKQVSIIRRKDLSTGEEKDIFRGFNANQMKISADGTRFAYFRVDKPNKSYVVAIMDIQSCKEMEIWSVPETDASGSVWIWAVTWTPDGKNILADRSNKQGSELWRLPVAGGPGEKLHFFPEESMGFVMHPDGKRIAFTQNRTSYELWMLENFLPK